MRNHTLYVHYDIEDDSVVVVHTDGTEDRRPCGSIPSDELMTLICDAILATETGVERTSFGLRRVSY